MPASTYPLKSSTNRRYLVDQNGKPFLIHGEAAWSLEVEPIDSDVDVYLADRQSRGVNAILMELIEHDFTTHAPANIYSVSPWTSTVFTTPNEPYFARVDQIINKCAAHGICVWLYPLYLGATAPEGWQSEVGSASTPDLQSWGTYVGNRYKTFPNIVWVIGGDVDPATWIAKVDAFATSLTTADPNHLVTAHNHHDTMNGVDPYTAQSWFTLNSVYAYDAFLNTNVQTAYNTSPVLPFFGIESGYEHEHSDTAQGIRAQFYWTVLTGGCGQFFGENPMWYFSFTGAQSFADGSQPSLDWRDARNLGSPGMLHRRFGCTLFESIPWYTLIPDLSHTVATAGYGTSGTTGYVTTALSADHTLLVAYLPTVSGLTIDMTNLNNPCAAYWFDPSNCSVNPIVGGPFTNGGSHTFTPSGTNAAGDSDWVLLLKAKNQTAVVTMAEVATVKVT